MVDGCRGRSPTLLVDLFQEDPVGDALRLEVEEAVLGAQSARRDGYGRVGCDERERRRLVAKPLRQTTTLTGLPLQHVEDSMW